MRRLRHLWWELFGPRYYVCPYEGYGAAATLDVELFGGCPATGIFRTRWEAEEYLWWVAVRQLHQDQRWPVIPVHVERLRAGHILITQYLHEQEATRARSGNHHP